MPQYKVIKPGFYAGNYYDPEGKRPVLHVDKPFTKKNKMPSWVSKMPKESDGLKAKRAALKKAQDELDAEEATTKNPATLGTAAAALQQGVSDQEQINTASTEGDGADADASFMGKNGSNVETI